MTSPIVKTDAAAASSSVKSTATTATMDDRDSCYFPGCRKDANCNCEICLASINATLDLMPLSIQKSSLTKLSASRRPNVERTPLSFDTSVISTPRSSSCPKILESPVLKSTARHRSKDKEMREIEWGLGKGVFLRLILGLIFIFVVAKGFSSCGVSGVLRSVFSADVVRSVGQRSWVVQDLSGKLRFLENELKGYVSDRKISNCSHMDAIWDVNQDGWLLYSRCVLYKSTMEEVSIWGWPLQTAGLLKAGFSSQSFTVLSGRVTEWADGKIQYSTWKANMSWVRAKRGASVLQLNPNTWILEYRRSWILDNSRLLPTMAEFFKYSMSGLMTRISQGISLLSAFEDQYSAFIMKDHIKIPT